VRVVVIGGTGNISTSIVRVLLERGSLSFSEMAEEFTADEMFVLVCITEMQAEMSRAETALRDYIKTIVPQWSDDLRIYAQQRRENENKGYGG